MRLSRHRRPVLQTSIRWIACSVLGLAFCLGPSKANAQANEHPSEPGERFVPSDEDPALTEAKRAVRLRDFGRAVTLWESAARKGHPRAQYRLGVAYRSGRGVEQDNAKAAFWFGKAAEAGDPDARYSLGKLYESGRGVERDRDRAMELIGLAARSGHREAKQDLERIQLSGSVAFATASGRVTANDKDPRAALAQAIRVGDSGAADEAIARGAPIDGAPGDSQHWRPLILAIDGDRPEIVKFLLERGADPNRNSRIGEPALILAVRSKNLRSVRSLLAAGSKPAARSISGTTPLMEAARLGLDEMTRDLLAARADPKATLQDGTSAADIARRFGFDELASRLRRAGAPARDDAISTGRFALNESTKGGSGSSETVTLPPLIEAARRGDAKLIRELIASGASLSVESSEGDSALHWAAAGGYAEASLALLEAGANPDAPGREGTTALMRAMASSSPGSEEVVSALSRAGADPHKRDRSSAGLIDYAASGATSKKLELILALGASWTDADLARSLEKAAVSGNLEAVKALIAVSGSPANRGPALCSAINTDQLEILDMLLSNELPADRSCGDGRTMLLMATQAGRSEVVEKLIQVGADPNSAADSGDTPLIAAASRGFAPIVSQLIRAGANVSHRGSHRMTPLMGAASNGHNEVVILLLEAGADRRMRGEADRTASDLASAAGHTEVAELIESFQTGWRAWLGSSRPASPQ